MRQTEIRDKYRDFINEHGVKQGQVADIIGVDFRVLSEFRNDKADLPDKALRLLKKFMTKYSRMADEISQDKE